MLTQRLCFSGTDEPKAKPQTMSPQSMVCSLGSPAVCIYWPPSLFWRERRRGLNALVPSPSWPTELKKKQLHNMNYSMRQKAHTTVKIIIYYTYFSDMLKCLSVETHCTFSFLFICVLWLLILSPYKSWRSILLCQNFSQHSKWQTDTKCWWRHHTLVCLSKAETEAFGHHALRTDPSRTIS